VIAAQSRRLVYTSDGWEFDLAQRELRLRGVLVHIGGRALEIFEVLVRSAGELVTKGDLMRRVWPGAIVEESALQVHISAIRKALGPDRDMLKTVFGRGYRLLGTWAIREARTPADPVDLEPLRVPVQPFRNNLQAAASELIGRTTAVQHLLDLLSAYRVVTLTGPGGIGKTALALEVARSLFPIFHGDCWFVELVSLSDPGLVPSAVAGVLGLKPGGGTISPEAIASAIGDNKVLLVLDNCEHLVDAAAKLVEAVVRLCPLTSILVTSREALRIDGETNYRVPPLDVPTKKQDDLSTVLGHSAVKLFIARTTALHFDFSPCEKNLSAIAAICRRLDGIPLAIEFAAARAATLGPQQVASRLDDRFALLTGGRRTALPRHQTLRATLDWSYQLLPEVERRLLRFVAVFPAKFTLEAATAVMQDAEGGGSNVMDALANLVTKSLVVLDGSDAVSRWRLLETTRAYALEKLAENGEADQAARRHATFFRDLFVGHEPASGAKPATERMPVYLREINNVRAALDWALPPGAERSAGDIAIGVAITAAYVPVWIHLSLMVECRERIECALDILGPDSDLSARLRMQLYIALGVALTYTTGMVERTGMILAQALEIAESLDDVESQLRALWAIWIYHSIFGEYRLARKAAETFIDVANRRGDPAEILVGDRLMGNVMHCTGNQPAARVYFERMLDQYVAPGDQRHTMWFHIDQRVVGRSILARVLWLQGFVTRAMHEAGASLEAAQALDQKLSVCYALGEAVCPIALMTGDFATAESSVAMLIDVATKQGLSFWATLGRCLRGKLLIMRGEVENGLITLRAELDMFTGRSMHYSGFLGDLAEALAGTGHVDEGLAVIDNALMRFDRDEVRWCLPDALRIKGELLSWGNGDETGAAAEVCFVAALAEARKQGALFWELRCAVSLARLRLEQHRPHDARQVLAPVYDRFTEGFEAADLRSATTMLASLPPPRTGLEV
jgi:predicted ATPase/DNA-binding winged helix-turn-helix (wHTH) protein